MAHQPIPDPIFQCQQRGIAMHVDSADTLAAIDAFGNAGREETDRIVAETIACSATLADDIVELVTSGLWEPGEQSHGAALRKLLYPECVKHLAREIAARAALADRRMRLGEPA